jgi:hypothetical protein
MTTIMVVVVVVVIIVISFHIFNLAIAEIPTSREALDRRCRMPTLIQKLPDNLKHQFYISTCSRNAQ